MFNILKILNPLKSLIWNLMHCAITLSFLGANTDQNSGWHIADTSIFPTPNPPHHHPDPNFRSQYDSKIFSSCFAVLVFNSVADAVQTHDTSHPPPSKPAFTSPRAALSSFRHLARTKAHSWYGIRTSSTSQWCSHSASFPWSHLGYQVNFVTIKKTVIKTQNFIICSKLLCFFFCK